MLPHTREYGAETNNTRARVAFKSIFMLCQAAFSSELHDAICSWFLSFTARETIILATIKIVTIAVFPSTDPSGSTFLKKHARSTKLALGSFRATFSREAVTLLGSISISSRSQMNYLVYFYHPNRKCTSSFPLSVSCTYLAHAI